MGLPFNLVLAFFSLVYFSFLYFCSSAFWSARFAQQPYSMFLFLFVLFLPVHSGASILPLTVLGQAGPLLKKKIHRAGFSHKARSWQHPLTVPKKRAMGNYWQLLASFGQNWQFPNWQNWQNTGNPGKILATGNPDLFRNWQYWQNRQLAIRIIPKLAILAKPAKPAKRTGKSITIIKTNAFMYTSIPPPARWGWDIPTQNLFIYRRVSISSYLIF